MLLAIVSEAGHGTRSLGARQGTDDVVCRGFEGGSDMRKDNRAIVSVSTGPPRRGRSRGAGPSGAVDGTGTGVEKCMEGVGEYMKRS